MLATLQILTITKKNLSASQTPKNALKNLPISNKICSKTKYKKNEAVVLCLSLKKKRINILQKVAVQSKKQKRKRNSKTPPTKNYSWMEWMLKTTVILTKIWFFFCQNFSASRKTTSPRCCSHQLYWFFFFLFQINVVKRNKKDNYSVCLNVAIFKSEQRKPLFLLFDL